MAIHIVCEGCKLEHGEFSTDLLTNKVRRVKVDIVECPNCGACPLLCELCAERAPCPKCHVRVVHQNEGRRS